MNKYYENVLERTLKAAAYYGKMAKLEGKLEVLNDLYTIVSKANQYDDVDYTGIIDVIDCLTERYSLDMENLSAERYKEDE